MTKTKTKKIRECAECGEECDAIASQLYCTPSCRTIANNKKLNAKWVRCESQRDLVEKATSTEKYKKRSRELQSYQNASAYTYDPHKNISKRFKSYSE